MLHITYSVRAALILLLAGVLGACATTSTSTTEPDNVVAEARITLNYFLRDPDQAWIQNNLKRARAVLIAPQIVRAGFIFGGSGGRAVLVARDGGTWYGPAFYDLGTASVGFQAGVDVSEAVILVMTEKAMNSLLSSDFKLGGDASVAAGPVGAGAKSNVMADFIAFTRAKGLYGGLSVDGTVVHVNSDFNAAYYGKPASPPDILIRRTVQSPKSMALLQDVAKAAK